MHEGRINQIYHRIGEKEKFEFDQWGYLQCNKRNSLSLTSNIIWKKYVPSDSLGTEIDTYAYKHYRLHWLQIEKLFTLGFTKPYKYLFWIKKKFE